MNGGVMEKIWPELTRVLYIILQFVNLGLTITALVFYIKGSMTAREPWKTLKKSFAANLIIATIIYVATISGQQVEPLILRMATTPILLTLAVSAYLGVKRNDPE